MIFRDLADGRCHVRPWTPKHDDTATEYDMSLLTQVLTSHLMLCNDQQSPSGLELTSATARGVTGLGAFRVLRCIAHAHHFCVACPPLLHDEGPSHPPSPCPNSRLDPHLRMQGWARPLRPAHRTRAFPHEDTPAARPCICMGLGRMGLQMRTAFQRAPSSFPPAPMHAGTVAWLERGGGSAGRTQQAGPTTETKRPGMAGGKRIRPREKPAARFDDPRLPGQGSRYHK